MYYGRKTRDDGPSLTPHFPASGFGRGIHLNNIDIEC
jgi:hypothetical protein